MLQLAHKIGWLKAPDIPFSEDDANRFLPWIIAFMVGLTALMLAISLSLSSAVRQWNGDYVNSFTIQLPGTNGAREGLARKVQTLVRENEWVEHTSIISDAEMKTLVKPWLGENNVLDSLPLPVLIEVKVREGQHVDVEALARRLRTLAPGAEIDDYQLWMGKFTTFSRMVQWGGFILAFLIVLTTLGIVILATKTALRLHQQTVEILYTIGAADDYIANQFQKNAMRLVLKGAALGSAVAAALFMVFQEVASSLESPLLPAVHFTFGHLVLFMLLPLLTANAAHFSTRFAVLSLLKRKL